jgi:hypothetical protein
MTFNGSTLAVTGNVTTTSTTSNYIGGVILSNSVISSPAATNLQITTPVGYNLTINPVNQLTMSGNVVSLTSGTTMGFTTTTANCNISFTTAGTGGVGINTTTPVTALDVNGGVTIRNGYRPTYSNVSSGTSLTISANTYGTHYNITTSGLTGITLPTVTGSTDSNAYWIFRNNTGSYLSITFTYTTTGTTFPTNPVTIPPASSVTMMVTYPSSVLGYVLF